MVIHQLQVERRTGKVTSVCVCLSVCKKVKKLTLHGHYITLHYVRGRTGHVVAGDSAASRSNGWVAVVVRHDHLDARHLHTHHCRPLQACSHTHSEQRKCSTSTHTQTHTHTFNGPFSGTIRVTRYRKGKPIWILLEQETAGHMQVCTSLQTDNHASTPPLCFCRPDALPAAQPTASKH